MSTPQDSNESPLEPGFFYCPSDNTGLVELSDHERLKIMNARGFYTAGFCDTGNKSEMTDWRCAMDNERIPTHRRSDAVLQDLNQLLSNRN